MRTRTRRIWEIMWVRWRRRTEPLVGRMLLVFLVIATGSLRSKLVAVAVKRRRIRIVLLLLLLLLLLLWMTMMVILEKTMMAV
jgi:hypothetical protein